MASVASEVSSNFAAELSSKVSIAASISSRPVFEFSVQASDTSRRPSSFVHVIIFSADVHPL
jgi:hypothetical protein